MVYALHYFRRKTGTKRLLSVLDTLFCKYYTSAAAFLQSCKLFAQAQDPQGFEYLPKKPYEIPIK